MHTRILTAAMLLSVEVLLVLGCSPNAPPKVPEYLQPLPSPMAQPDLTKKLRSCFPADAVVPREQGFDNFEGEITQDRHDSGNPSIWSSEHHFWFSVKDEALKAEPGLEKGEGVVNGYLADLSKKISELGGSFTAGKSERKEGGFTVSSTYRLSRRTGKVQVTLQPHAPPRPGTKKVLLLITEDAEGEAK
jgi:hypothetical protein